MISRALAPLALLLTVFVLTQAQDNRVASDSKTNIMNKNEIFALSVVLLFGSKRLEGFRIPQYTGTMG
uniref:Secreted protein n=1 Tax=Heterorhabditis bacteriophora TaxID=37862 RepID=A0A1I7WSB8_HETBA